MSRLMGLVSDIGNTEFAYGVSTAALAPQKPRFTRFTTPAKHIIIGFLDSNTVIQTMDGSR